MAFDLKTMHDTDVLLGEQATWGTALADAANYNLATPTFGSILDVKPTSIDPDVKIRLPARSNSGRRTLIDSNIQFDTKGSVPKITVAGDAKLHDIASLLYAVVQNVSEGAVTPFTKSYTFPATQPDFTAGAGWFGSCVLKNPTAGMSQRIKDVICRKLTLTCAPNDGEGRLQYSAELVGRGVVDFAANPTGTLTRAAETFFYFHDLKTCSIDSSINPVSINIEITNNAIPVGVDLANPGLFLTHGLPRYECKMTLGVLWDSTARGLQSAFPSGTARTITVEWGTAGNTGHLKFVLLGYLGPAPDKNEELKTIDFTVTGASINAADMLTVTCSDAVDRNWP